MLHVELREDNFSEKKYIIDYVLNEILGIEFEYVLSEINYIQISDGVGKFKTSDIFFNSLSNQNWLTQSTLPKTPLSYLNLIEVPVETNIPNRLLPVFYGMPKVDYKEKSISTDVDLFGGAFFVLSRYEEGVIEDGDKHDRFCLKNSILHRENLVNRPVVNEYIEFLWANLKYLWPALKRKERKARTLVSCDVDHLWDRRTTSLFFMLKGTSSALVKRRSIKEAFNIIIGFFKVSFLRIEKADSFNTFDFMMSECEKNGLKMAFYFICGNSAGKIDGYYSIESHRAKELLKEIDSRGHEVGIHLSYNTYLEEANARKELKTLTKVLGELSINAKKMGGRQHYLRWNSSQTAEIWDNLGLNYDSTLTFAEQAGFRCGICYEFPLYHLQNRKKLDVVERPLIVMEGSLLNPRYKSLSVEDAIMKMSRFKELCKHYNGDFTLLWHNTFLSNHDLKEGFKKAIKIR
jgi:hypothetical protein